MATDSLPDAETLRQLLDYNSDTGTLTWRTRPIEGFPLQRIGRTWNTRFSGKAAGTVGAYGYLYVEVNGSRPIGAHRAAWAITHGTWAAMIDHINGDPLDNRLSNLREVTSAANQRNMRRGKDNTSGCMGVSRTRNGKKWRAYIAERGKQVCLGTFDDFDDAVRARKAAEQRFGYHANHGRE